MTEEANRVRSASVADAAMLFPGELDIDAVGMWQIVPKGRDRFGLSGDALLEFVRRSIYALTDAGAVAVRTGKGTGYEWVAQLQYGSTREKVADAVIDEWQQNMDDPHILYRVWFARPDPKRPHFVKMD